MDIPEPNPETEEETDFLTGDCTFNIGANCTFSTGDCTFFTSKCILFGKNIE